MKKRIAVTGIGVISPLGSDCRTLWENLIQGISGIGPIEELSGLPVTFGGRARGFDPSRHLGPKDIRRMDRYTQMAVTCGLDAYGQAGLPSDTYPAHRVGVLMGTGAGGMETIEEQVPVFREKGARRVSPLTVPMFIPNIASAELAMKIKANGPGMGLSSACATGGHALAVAMRLIQAGDADCMVAGGVEACLTPFSVSAFASMRALSTRNDDPARACRPFDRDRDGFVIAEGGAALVLEDLDRARSRGADVLGILAGAGMSQDAYHLVAPDPEATAVVHAMERALEDAGVSREDIGYINAHGTSTPLNDKTETLAVKKVFGPRAYEIPMSSTKSMTGHLIGGTASLEAAICILAMRNGTLPPTINLDNPDPECDLNYIPGRAVRAEVSYCMNDSFAFGGQNAVLVIGRDG
ncbi:MAG TPA: beta-ketoacyl-ACP synthase II [Deltaproteobacteria bacterium]|nr:beta-ketoacyl-ACP synthase II [Deltaproteobacteria bacterium]HPR54579.1 beta-ketoacyl-ACP synthase II [Deltaproteobacteria bacterium]HXK48009.1 beta-ketoacyl-ACP synthase II [Deltaproteobacteria bacterium]